MRLTALCVCGTLLAFLSLSWTTADSDEGDLLGDNDFEPCSATLRPEGPCRQGHDESTCPYLFSLPPLTVHLPKQLRELEKIVRDLQKLKDNVDQLRKMCADCTVSQTERECGRQREHEKLNGGRERHMDERNWLNGRNPQRLQDFSRECGIDRVKTEKSMEGDGDTDSGKRTILEEKGRKKWEAEREHDKGVVKENEKEETLKEVVEMDGKTLTEGAKENDKLGKAKVPTAGGYERTEADRNKEQERKGNSKGDRRDSLENGKERKIPSNVKDKKKTEERENHMWLDETEKKTQTKEDRGSDGIKMSEDHDEHTNKEREKHREERKEEKEKGIKVERNNEKPKQTESIGRAEKEKTIKEGELEEEEEDRETGKEIKTEGEKTVQSVQRDSDGELASSKTPARTDFVSISPTSDSIISLAPRHDSMDSNKAITFTSSLPSPPLSSSTSHLITDINPGMAVSDDGLPTQSTSFRRVGIADVGAGIRTKPTTTATISTLAGPGQQITSSTSRFTSTTSARARAGFQGQVGSNAATTTTTTPLQSLYTTTFPGVADRSLWTPKTNISSNTKPAVKPLPSRGPKPGEKHKPAIKPEADQKLKNTKNVRKSDRAPLPDKKTKHDQKQKPSHQKPTTNQKSKPGKDPKRVKIPKPDQRPLPDNLPTGQIPKHDQKHTTDQNQSPIQKPNSQKYMLPVLRPTSHQRPQTVNATGSGPLNGREPESEKSPVHPLKIDKPGQKQNPHKKPKEETKSDQRSTSNQYLTPVPEPKPEESGTTSFTPKLNQKPVTELMDNSDENPLLKTKSKDSTTPGEKLTPDYVLIKPPDETSEPGLAPKLNQIHPEILTGQKSKPNVKPRPDQTAQTNQGLTTPHTDQMPNLNPASVPDESHDAGSNKTSKSAQRPQPAAQIKPSPKTRTDLDPPQISGTTSDGIQYSQTNIPPASGPVKQIAEETHSPGDTEFIPSTMKTITLGPKTSNSLETGPFPRLHTLSKGFTMSPNSRITSDLRPQTAGQPPPIPMTTTPNIIIHGIFPSVVPSTGPGPTKPDQASNTDSNLQAKILYNVEEAAGRKTPYPDKMKIPVPTPSAQTTSTTSTDLRSTTPATSGPEPPPAESSTTSARELRVKINQVAAFLNKNGRPPDRRPKQHPEDNQGGSRPEMTESKLPTLIPSKVTMTRTDCSDHLLMGETKSGVYLVTPDRRSRSFPVFCDMELDGGGWTLLQRRQDGSVNFNRTWAEYRSGFGELDGGEFWLGNNMIHLLTRERDMVLRVELEDFDGVMEYAEYEQFKVASERMRFRLTVDGYSGTAGDALRFSKTYDHNNRAFTTSDRDHDRYPSGNCGAYYSSGWWFDACMAANLNGRYHVGRYKGVRDGIFWGTWHNISAEYYPTNDRQSFKTVRMMIRPKGFAP